MGTWTCAKMDTRSSVQEKWTCIPSTHPGWKWPIDRNSLRCQDIVVATVPSGTGCIATVSKPFNGSNSESAVTTKTTRIDTMVLMVAREQSVERDQLFIYSDFCH